MPKKNLRTEGVARSAGMGPFAAPSPTPGLGDPCSSQETSEAELTEQVGSSRLNDSREHGMMLAVFGSIGFEEVTQLLHHAIPRILASLTTSISAQLGS